jgi:ribosome biogenesis GTPase A
METRATSGAFARTFKGGQLDALFEVAAAAGGETIAGEARKLAERLEQGRFHVACVGQFKRGKSTLLNALVARAVLPTGVVPVTSAVTILRYGGEEGARVFFASGRSGLGLE